MHMTRGLAGSVFCSSAVSLVQISVFFLRKLFSLLSLLSDRLCQFDAYVVTCRCVISATF